MKKTFTSLFLVFSLIIGNIPITAAATNPQLKYEMDCLSQDKRIKIGYVSDPTNPSTGPEIIAFKLVLQLIPSVSTTVSDLKTAKLEQNTAYSNLIIAENKGEELTTSFDLTVAGGFTGQTGLNQVADLFHLTGIGDKTYRIKVKEGEMYEKGNTSNIFNVPTDFFSVDPSSCTGSTSSTGTSTSASTGSSSTTGGTSSTTAPVSNQTIIIANMKFSPSNITVGAGSKISWINNDTVPHTVSSMSGTPLNSGTLAPGEKYEYTFSQAGSFDYRCNIHPTTMSGKVTVQGASSGSSTGASGTSSSTTTGSGSSTTPDRGATSSGTTSTSTSDTITLSSDKDNPVANDVVTVTALIKDRKEASIDWRQTSGTQIQPTIENEELASGDTKSDLTFTMPADTNDVVLKVVVGGAEGSITIPGTKVRNAASTDQTATGTQEANSLAERLAARRQEQQDAAVAGAAAQGSIQQAGNVHASAGGLAGSGPTETSAMLLISLLIVFGLKKRKVLEI